jgi:hypothetical protein
LIEQIIDGELLDGAKASRASSWTPGAGMDRNVSSCASPKSNGQR